MKDIVEGFRKAMVEVLIPEIRQLREEMNARFEEINERFEEMNERFSAICDELHEIKEVQREILVKLDLDKRVTRVEAVLERLEKKVG